MTIAPIDLPAELRRVRKNFDQELANTLRERTDLTLTQIAKQFCVSNKVIRRVIKDFSIKPRTVAANGQQRRSIATTNIIP
jgi:transcription initiation factor IIE alpha subunit